MCAIENWFSRVGDIDEEMSETENSRGDIKKCKK